MSTVPLSKLREIQDYANPNRPEWLGEFISIAKELEILRLKIANNNIDDKERERCIRLSKPIEHVCGLQGFGRPADVCRGCDEEQRRREWDKNNPGGV
jgi:hypothetical protein